MADEPETTPDAGTGDEAAADQTEETPASDTPADDSADAGDGDSSGDDGHAAETKGETSVPYARFKNVNERRKAAEARTKELEAQLAAATPKEPAKPQAPKDRLKGLKPADPSLSPLEQFEFYGLQAIENHPEIIDQWFEKKFGMPPEMAASTIAQTRPRVQADIRRDFEAACKERGLDPSNPTLQHMVGTALDSGKARTFGEAMDVFVKPKTGASSPKKVNGRGAEADGVDASGLTRVKIQPKTAKEAAQLAAKGQGVEQLSVTDILKANLGV